MTKTYCDICGKEITEKNHAKLQAQYVSGDSRAILQVGINSRVGVGVVCAGCAVKIVTDGKEIDAKVE